MVGPTVTPQGGVLEGADAMDGVALGGFAALNANAGPGRGDETGATHAAPSGIASSGGFAGATWAREAAESELRGRVEAALKLLRDGDRAMGKRALQDLLDSGEEASSGRATKQLRFIAAKNLAKQIEEESAVADAPANRRHTLQAEALALYVRATSYDANDVVVWHRLGSLAWALGKTALARLAFERGLALSPGHELLLGKAIALELLARLQVGELR